MTDLSDVASVVSVAPDLVQIEVVSSEEYRDLNVEVEIGSYLKISDDNGLSMVVIVKSYRIKDRPNVSGHELATLSFIIDTQPVGRLQKGKFSRGGKQIAIPPTRIEIAERDVLEEIYSGVEGEKRFSFGSLAQNAAVRVVVDGDKFFGKHIGVIGSTGSGKSCTVAKILQEGTKRSTEQQEGGILNNSHVIIFDLHGEYRTAFPEANVVDTNNLKLPYWLMNSEELEEMFIESHENNSHNQISQFRQAVIENKKLHLRDVSRMVSYDSPVYFSLREVINYLSNLNSEVIGKLPGESLPKLANGDLVQSRSHYYFSDVLEFVQQSASSASKASNGPFHGEFNRFLMRLDARQNDMRLAFLLDPRRGGEAGAEYGTEDLAEILGQFTGYGRNREDRSNVTIIDLSGIPFEVLSVVVSLITRLIFTFNFYLKKYKHSTEGDLPFLLVYEEAHNYIPQSDGARYSSVKKAIERIAKEGRKYGVSLMIVSQRPSEVSETVFSQCNNFVAMRLTNPVDQHYVRRLLPDNVGAITDALPTLEKREVIVIGDSILIPSLVKVDYVEARPDSRDIDFHTEWQRDWLDVAVQDIIERWQE
ncbi:ATPase [Sphaerisporangium siamense]|uniref:DNA helicase HerA-like ATPase n=1 Tax=Sphaerisporangium siamense TaxID=795645 RepID=A0A7W7D5L9_9ACTN|nr:ATP-binding protein [Sphaerisporangium siamense]MBB4700632.1 DNA helicase HerA-like ATPase [Sphaerisporangium siamense]GII89692.1 ATPase [Sphaerisporangium siamense]